MPTKENKAASADAFRTNALPTDSPKAHEPLSSAPVLGQGRAASPSGARTGAVADASSSADDAVRRHSNRRARVVIAGLAVFVVAAMLVSFGVGRYPMSPEQVCSMLLSRAMPVDVTWTPQQEALFFNVRLPRVILALLVGCCLSAAGAAFQGVFQNPLVSPGVLGASQGAAFGAAWAILLGSASAMVMTSAFLWSLASVAIVLLIARRAKGDHVLMTVPAGVMVSSLFSAGVSFAKLVTDPQDQLPDITYWLMGSLTGTKLDMTFASVLPFMVAGFVALFVLRWKLNVLTCGDDEARTMGVDARRLRTVVILASTMVTAASVSVSGMIGWVGLVVPHVCRMLVGVDYRSLMPASMLAGAGFLLLVDDVSRLATTAEIPIGILTAFIGAPFFCYLIMSKRQAR